MRPRTPKSPGTAPGTRGPRRPAASATGTPEVVDPRWLLRAVAIAAGAALVLGYASVCLLVALGGWQLLLHPTRTVDRTPASVGIAFEPVRFDAGPTGTPRLTGWWIPGGAPDASANARPTLLFVHDGTGSLSTALPLLVALHGTGSDVFAFDPRGFGASGASHPSEEHMHEDAEAALAYLETTRGRDVREIVPFGNGLGAALAATLVHTHPELPAIIVDNPDPEIAERLADGGQMRLIPVHLLLRDRFELSTTLRALSQPKLLITGGPGLLGEDHTSAALALFRQTASPKIAVTLGHDDPAHFRESVARFLDEIFPASVPRAPATTDAVRALTSKPKS